MLHYSSVEYGNKYPISSLFNDCVTAVIYNLRRAMAHSDWNNQLFVVQNITIAEGEKDSSVPVFGVNCGEVMYCVKI